jgi:hypothetical protein
MNERCGEGVRLTRAGRHPLTMLVEWRSDVPFDA